MNAYSKMTDNEKYRLVTRADFDGIVSGALLMEIGMISEIAFAEPNDIQNGLFKVASKDITTNLPYVEGVHLCLDHHTSEIERVGEQRNHIINPNAPSAARVVYEYFGGKNRFTEISDELMNAVDRADSADYSEADILAPEGWTLLNFLLDPRTGIARFEKKPGSHEDFAKDMMLYLRHHPIEEILAIPDVQGRVHFYFEQEEKFEFQLRSNSFLHGEVLVLDLRDEEVVYAGNRFTVYALYPECTLSIQLSNTASPEKITVAMGKSILNKSNNTDIGSLMLEFGGGGHRNAGTCQIASNEIEALLPEIVERVGGNFLQ